MAGGGQVIDLLGRFSRAIAVTGFVCGLTLTVTVISTEGAAARVFKVIHTFKGGNDGEFPEAGLTQAGGKLYGTTFGSLLGGAPGKTCSKGCGNEYAIFGKQLTPGHFFKAGSDGAFPTGEVVVQNGTVFGTTEFGGGTACGGGLGCGVAFLVTSTGKEQHHEFCTGLDFPDCANGAFPHAGPIIGIDQNLYGTTSLGGAANGYECDSNFSGCGTVYMLTPDLKSETVLYNFCSQPGCPDGAIPLGKLLQDGSGNFYGTTQFGGKYGAGTVFELQPTNGMYTESVLYSFCQNAGCPDGAIPEAGLIADVAGNLYGTASAGGTGGCTGSIPGCGVVFELSESGGAWAEARLYAFAGGTDGALPLAPLVARNGNLYGATQKGGGGPGCSNPNIGCGTVFKWAVDGTETPIHTFGVTAADGAAPVGALLLYKGYLYGATRVGGVSLSNCKCGTLFKISTANRVLTGSRQAHGRPRGRVSRSVQTKTHPAS